LARLACDLELHGGHPTQPIATSRLPDAMPDAPVFFTGGN
jgi:hypothetical protein